MAKDETVTRSVRLPKSLLKAVENAVAKPGNLESANSFIVRAILEQLKREGAWPIAIKAVILALLVFGSLAVLYARLHTPHMTSEIYRIAER